MKATLRAAVLTALVFALSAVAPVLASAGCCDEPCCPGPCCDTIAA